MAETETPAEVLRRAAGEMRQRAEAATPGPWRPVAGIWQTETFAAVIGPEGVAEDAETWLMATGRGAASQEADADHAASWHPLVALAVAEWLDEMAEAVEGIPSLGRDHVDGAPCDDYACRLKHAALGVARAYLNEPATTGQDSSSKEDGRDDR